MLKYKKSMLWACAKEICKQKHEKKSFKDMKDLKQYVKDNKDLLPCVVEGFKVVI
ncbi:hypothetical protein [uncultured Clostridium sp.]|uniref:hypothetical protein n=1 Tax=uncultured Clostridium sp. TaxID=59620 RepID=UPI00321730C2